MGLSESHGSRHCSPRASSSSNDQNLWMALGEVT